MNKKNFKNYVVVSNTFNNHLVNLELNYQKDNSILIRNFKISTLNVKQVLERLKTRFEIFYENTNYEIEHHLKNDYQLTNHNNHLINDINFNPYRISFNQNFYNNYLKND